LFLYWAGLQKEADKKVLVNVFSHHQVDVDSRQMDMITGAGNPS
jgi:hypothetical protein